MRKVLWKGSMYIGMLVPFCLSFASAQSVQVLPEHIVQGEPVMVRIKDVASVSAVSKITFDERPIGVFVYQSLPSAFLGIDLYERVGGHSLKITLADGKVIEKTIFLEKRKMTEMPLGIPEKLGGNTVKSQKNLASSLTKENNLLLRIPTSKKQLWNKNFIFPVLDPIVVDPYGYERLTGEYTIAHRGTDFRAPTGTNVYAMNRGIVRVAKTSPVYGKMVVIDHGLGLMTFYLHLSKINVHRGDVVEQGVILGKSGQTGYALSPHLHVSVRINNISIDPIAFLAFFN